MVSVILECKGIFVWVCSQIFLMAAHQYKLCTDVLPLEIFDQISHLMCTNAVGNHMHFMTKKQGSKGVKNYVPNFL